MTTATLDGRTIAFLVSGKGIEQPELTGPWQAIKDAGGKPVLLSPDGGKAATVNNDLDPAEDYPVDGTIADADPGEYDGVIIPGGTVNADTLRTDEDARNFVRAAAQAGRPIAAICHGPWLLVDAGLVEGRTLTSYPSLQTDIRNAGGTWVDEQVKIDDSAAPLITSRNPDDIPAFVDATIKQFAGDRG
ncbi:type 1 glutamine amidotransferase domain-containing protein [Naumannella huperziae]